MSERAEKFPERVRVMRIVVYEGDREWVQRTVEMAVHGRKDVGDFGGALRRSITAVTVSEFPEALTTCGKPVGEGGYACTLDAGHAVPCMRLDITREVDRLRAKLIAAGLDPEI